MEFMLWGEITAQMMPRLAAGLRRNGGKFVGNISRFTFPFGRAS
jgi:hypothetical protein